MDLQIVPGRIWAVLFSTILLLCESATADVVTYLDFGGTWRYFPGVSEASTPDPTAWRAPNFDDGAWATGIAPFGYGRNPPYGTDLSTLEPPMRNNYTTVFLRGTFEIAAPDRVGRFVANAVFDDAFILFINGQEVHRSAGMPADEVVPFDAFSTRTHSPRPTEIPLGDASVLVEGTNSIAVQAANRMLTNSDFKFDIELLDTDGPDLRSPAVHLTRPFPGSVVRSLTEIQVMFDEPVTGVSVASLLINGAPGTQVVGEGAGPYRFSIPLQPTGIVNVRWDADHGITDVSPDHNAFQGGSWTYQLDPDAAPPRIVINEIVAANRTGLTEEDGDRSGWIELANVGTVPVTLSGMSLSDEPREPGKWVFPDSVMEPGGFLVVFASREDIAVAGAELHTNFALGVGGSYLGLFSSEVPREPIFELSPEYPRQAPDVAYGLSATGSLAYLDPPTPGAPNTEAATFEAIVERPIATVEHGFFDGPFQVELRSSTDGAEIRYTTDGTEPNQTDGLIYAGAMTIESTTGLRARAFVDGWVPSPIFTTTYLFLNDVVAQETLNPAVVDDPGSNLKDALLSIPTLSIVMDPDEVFGPTGAYNAKGDHPASVELLNSDGDGGFQVDCSIEHHSNASPKTSLRLLFKREYGAAKLRYPLFESDPVHADSAVTAFDRIILRSGKNQSWTSGRFLDLVTYVEDQWVRDSQRAMSGIGSHGTFVHLYINGAYWGLYNPVERPDHWFTSAYFGGDERDYFATNFNVTEGSGMHIRGDPSRYDRIIELAVRRELGDDPTQYAEFLELVDVDKFIDYVMLFWFSGFGDGINNNWYAGMRLNPPGKFQFFMWDGEFIFLSTAGPPGNATAWVHPNFFSGSEPMVRIWLAFFDNAEFRVRFADRVFKHCFHGGALSRESSQRRLKALTDFIDTAIIGESARWGGTHRRDPTWLSAVERLQDKLEDNVEIFITALRNWRDPIYPPFDPPLLSQQGGTVASGFEVRAFTTAGRIVYTIDGSDPRLPGGAVSPQALELDSAENLVTILLDDVASARMHVPTDGSLGMSWIQSDFDDSTWSTVQTGIGYDQRERFTDAITTNIEADLFEKNSSVYLRLEFDVEDPAIAFLWLDMKYDDGFVAYLNGTPLASLNAPEELTWDAVTPRLSSASNEYRVFDVSRLRDALRAGRNVLAIQGINRTADDSDFLLSPRLRAGVFGTTAVTVSKSMTLHARVVSEDTDTGENVWSALNAAPFTVPEGSAADLQITEISYNPDADGAEFIEIHNPTAAEMTLDGIAFTNGIGYTFGTGDRLPGGGYVVLVRDADLFPLAHPDIAFAGTYVGALANDGEKVTLQDPEGNTIVSVDYNDGDFWPLGADGLGYTLVLADPTGDPDDPRTWRTSSLPGGSPGEMDSAPIHDGVWISEVLPGPEGAVELWNWSGAAIDVGGWFLSPDRTDAASLMATPIVAGTSIPPGGYVVVQATDLSFPIDPTGDAIYLSAADADGLSGYVTGVDFGGIENGVALGIHKTSTGLLNFTALSTVTLGAPNASPRAPQVAINEIHYHPVDGESEFLELFNPGGSPINVEGWEIRGVFDVFDENSFRFPPGAVIPPAGFLVLVPGDPEGFRAQYGVPAAAVVVGPYSGGLSNAGEALRLRKPLGNSDVFTIVDEADYNDRAPWPPEADGDGNALERIDASSFGSDAMSWAASLSSGGTPGTTNSVSEPVEPPDGGLQRPGDLTQDARLNLLDATVLLDQLFGKTPPPLPCADSLADTGNRMLLDGDGSGAVDVSDVLRLLNFLFQRGPTHALGTTCTILPDCPAACGD